MENEQQNGGGIDALDRIALEASGDENAAQAAENELLNPEPEGAIDPAAAWAQLPMMFGGILSIAMPEMKGVYTEDKCLAWGAAMAQVAQKYGWDAGETMSRWAPEIALTVASIPLVLPTMEAIKQRKIAARAKSKSKEPVQDVSVHETGPAPVPGEGGKNVNQ